MNLTHYIESPRQLCKNQDYNVTTYNKPNRRNYLRAMELNPKLFQLKPLTAVCAHICMYYTRFVNVETGAVYYGN